MEQTGEKGNIQISAFTAKLLSDAGMSSWFMAREGQVGENQTYFITKQDGSDSNSMTSFAESYNGLTNLSSTSDKISRLVEWNTDILSHHLQKIVSKLELKYIAR